MRIRQKIKEIAKEIKAGSITKVAFLTDDLTIHEYAAIRTALEDENSKVKSVDLIYSNENSDSYPRAREFSKLAHLNIALNLIKQEKDLQIQGLLDRKFDAGFVSDHKKELFLAAVAACAIVAVYYKKPEMLTNLKGMFFGLFEKASAFVMGK